MRESEKILKVKIFRYDPTQDHESYYQDYQVPVEEQETILGVLDYIRENIDPGLAYRDSCAYGCCAICIMKVNGKNVLACTEKVQGNELLIEPVRTDKILRDLATIF